MPLLSHFYGILITIYTEEGGKHHKPHCHARYAEFEAVYDLEGNCIKGKLPSKQHKYVVAWAALYEDSLNAAWTAWQKYGEVLKIEGLR
ncbi:MAG: DUF4160 domain-containing protein [Clostridiales bacterium]|jgi:hypothetical protein|nr:DUF4160 domain-containing protein [Clostridiales bacterium]